MENRERMARRSTIRERMLKSASSYLVPLLLGCSFISLALLISIIYTGLGYRSHKHIGPLHRKSHSFRLPNTQAKLNKSKAQFCEIDKYPFIGALISLKPYVYVCTFIILNNRYLLTRANCITDLIFNYRARVGSNFWNKQGVLYKIESVVLHQYFNKSTLENNFALMLLKNNIKINTKIKSIDFQTVPQSKNSKGTVVGWSPTKLRGVKNRLLLQELRIWKPTRCGEYVGQQFYSEIICASSETKSIPCKFGITGVLFNGQDKMIGIWSTGMPCTGKAAIFYKTSSMKRWIEDNSLLIRNQSVL